MLDLEAKTNPFDSLVEFIRQITNPGKGEIDKVGDAVRLGFQANFSNESSGYGHKWTALAPKTQAVRKKLGFASQHPILVRTGSYRASFVQRGAPNHIEELTTTGDGWQLVTGSRDPRGDILNNGGYTIIDGYRVFVPARPVDGLSGPAQERVRSTIGFILEETRARTLGR